MLEKDFIEALASARGHTRPQATEVISCEGCGADFILPERLISDACPYCHSPYVLDHSQVKELVAPSGLLPFLIKAGRAAMALRRFLDERGIRRTDPETPPEALFTPVWTFDVTGEMPYSYQEKQGDDWLPRRGSQIVVVNDLPVIASRNFPAELSGCADGFDLGAMIEFDPSHLAGLPAQLYDLTASDAAMKARFQILERARTAARSKLFGRVRDYRPHSPDLLVSDYRLILLPLWLTSFDLEGGTYAAAVNGRSGEVTCRLPSRGWQGWLDWLLGRAVDE